MDITNELAIHKQNGKDIKLMLKLIRDLHFRNVPKYYRKSSRIGRLLFKLQNPVEKIRCLLDDELFKLYKGGGVTLEISKIYYGSKLGKSTEHKEVKMSNTTDLNNLRRLIFNRTNRLIQIIEMRLPEIMLRNEKKTLREAVDALTSVKITDQIHRETVASREINKTIKSLTEVIVFMGTLSEAIDVRNKKISKMGDELLLNAIFNDNDT